MPYNWAASLAHVQIRELPLQIGQLGQVVEDNVRLVRMAHQIILVVALGLIKRLQRRYLCHDGSREGAGRLQLGYVRLRDSLLL